MTRRTIDWSYWERKESPVIILQYIGVNCILHTHWSVICKLWVELPKTISKEKREKSSSLVYVLHKTWSWVFRLRPHVSRYFWIRNFFFPGTASVHTYSLNPYLFESALQNENVWIRYESGVVRTLNPDIFYPVTQQDRAQFVTVKGRERRKFQIWYQVQHPIEHYSQIHKIQCGERIGGTHHQVRDVKRASTTQANLGNFACIKHFVTFVLERVEI